LPLFLLLLVPFVLSSRQGSAFAFAVTSRSPINHKIVIMSEGGALAAAVEGPAVAVAFAVACSPPSKHVILTGAASPHPKIGGTITPKLTYRKVRPGGLAP
jgi:hypothetical protein